ncbi:MAG: deoxyribodipyrimidine photo-lyase [Halothiobacillaceae bacterium]|nr:deoxyribodipyrimidine photo-lyase [Halothiobacillaceae bacterium]
MSGIVWFRRDLRLSDNPAFHESLAQGPVVAVFILPEEGAQSVAPGAAARWWLHHSLAALDAALRARGGRLILRRGEPLSTLRTLVRETGATRVSWNRLYDPHSVARDTAIKTALREDGLTVRSHNAALWFEPWQLTKHDGEPYRVFTPYWKAALRAGLPQDTLPAPERLPPPPIWPDSLPLARLDLEPRIPWDRAMRTLWQPGEAGAWAALQAFLPRIDAYHEQRDRMDRPGTSRLSPHLAFGEIGPRQILATLQGQLPHDPLDGQGSAHFLRELGWREFSFSLLHHFPHLPETPLDERFERLPWREDSAQLAAWQRGQTGIPIIDAALRELWTTGWMHNRARMLAASFLSKNLLIDWRAGERWFRDTLLDADWANNVQGWQWTAGCGADAAPYFRLFNPVLQARKFDPEGHYTRRWVPELAALPTRDIHAPWEASPAVRQAAGLVLGRDYPHPIVDLAITRERALAAFARLREPDRSPTP